MLSNSSLGQNETSSSTRDGSSWDDATWILSMSFIIFTMQTGFGLLEAGAVQLKNEVNIMIKNVADVVFGGLTYWAFGYAFSFGTSYGSNPFCGIGKWFVSTSDLEVMGELYSSFIFQLSFTTTATTIVSGAMAERAKLNGYIIFSFLNTLVYCFPAHWIWADNGFLRAMGVVDIAGSGAVHLLGGTSAFVAAWMLGPRIGRYDKGYDSTPPGNPTNSLLGTFMLWWGWLAFNSGSTYGISGGKWILAAKASTTTMLSSMGGGLAGMAITYIKRRKYDVTDIVNSILGALVGVTAGCAIYTTWEAVIIGLIGGTLSCLAPAAVNRLKIDDPVGAVAVHAVGGIWGMLAVGLFGDDDRIENYTGGRKGLFRGGGFYLLGIQTLSCLCIIVWSMGCTAFILYPINKTVGVRIEAWEEELGVDYVEHGILRDPCVRELVNMGYPQDQRIVPRISMHSSFGVLSGHTSNTLETTPRRTPPATTSTTIFVTEAGSDVEGVTNAAMDVEAAQDFTTSPSSVDGHI